MSWRTHYGQAFATLWGVQSQSAAISCQASRAVEGQAPQHKASDHPTNLEEPRRALSVTTDRIFVRQKDVPEKQKKKRSSTKPLITLVGGKLKPFFTIDLKNFDLGSICLHKPFLRAASIILPASNQGCAPQRSTTRDGVDSLIHTSRSFG